MILEGSLPTQDILSFCDSVVPRAVFLLYRDALGQKKAGAALLSLGWRHELLTDGEAARQPHWRAGFPFSMDSTHEWFGLRILIFAM